MKYPFAIALCLAAQVGQAETLADYMESGGSHVSITLDVPYSALADLVKTRLKDVYSGEKSHPFHELKDDRLIWQARPGAIALSAEGGKLVARGSASGTARLEGKLALVPVDVSADLAVAAEVGLVPQLRSDWSLAPGLGGTAQLTEAELFGVSVRRLLQDDLDKAFADALAVENAKLAAPGYLKSRFDRLWRGICGSDDDPDRLRARPQSVAATQPVVRADALRMTVVITATVGAGDKMTGDCPPLPDTLTLLD